jgi:hypothetical protein
VVSDDGEASEPAGDGSQVPRAVSGPLRAVRTSNSRREPPATGAQRLRGNRGYRHEECDRAGG